MRPMLQPFDLSNRLALAFDVGGGAAHRICSARSELGRPGSARPRQRPALKMLTLGMASDRGPRGLPIGGRILPVDGGLAAPT